LKNSFQFSVASFQFSVASFQLPNTCASDALSVKLEAEGKKLKTEN
jgi:hypothetical protein